MDSAFSDLDPSDSFIVSVDIQVGAGFQQGEGADGFCEVIDDDLGVVEVFDQDDSIFSQVWVDEDSGTSSAVAPQELVELEFFGSALFDDGAAPFAHFFPDVLGNDDCVALVVIGFEGGEGIDPGADIEGVKGFGVAGIDPARLHGQGISLILREVFLF